MELTRKYNLLRFVPEYSEINIFKIFNLISYCIENLTLFNYGNIFPYYWYKYFSIKQRVVQIIVNYNLVFKGFGLKSLNYDIWDAKTFKRKINVFYKIWLT